jgi:hypothetical protein
MEYPDASVGNVPNKYGKTPAFVSAYQHKNPDCGLIVLLECDPILSSVSFRHAMTPEQARQLAEFLVLAADYIERAAVPYPEAVGA